MINASKTITDKINEIFDGLKVSWPYFVFSLIALGLLTLMITFLVYKPVKKMLKQRQTFIQNNIDESIKAKEKAIETQENIDKQIIEANLKVSNILTEAKSESEKIINDGISKAEKQGEMLIEQANILVEKKYAEFEKVQKKIIVENAVELAKKILKRELKDKDNKKLVQELLES